MARAQWREWLRPRLRWRRAWAKVFPPPYGVPHRAVVNGFPKGGTHLLVRCATLLGGEQRVDFFFDRKMGGAVQGGPGIPLGIGEPVAVAPEEVERRLAGLGAGEFAVGHIPYSEEFAALLDRFKLRMVFILRDPRDVVVSLVHHTLTDASNRLHGYFKQTLNGLDECLLAGIAGVKANQTRDGMWLASIGQQLEWVKPWLTAPVSHTTRFERLVGPQGGGSAKAQREEIARIAGHLGLSLTPAQIDEVASRLFGQGSPTFRRGQIGSWKEHFREEHKDAFKRVAGKQLLEMGYERDLNW
ncbi:MAG: sulfotransferase domain-containing protein [Terriglobia bacterium]